ncbi:MAG: S1C family serine protease [Terriglobales bacterium]
MNQHNILWYVYPMMSGTKLAAVSGWVLAAALGTGYIVSHYRFSISHRRPDSSENGSQVAAQPVHNTEAGAAAEPAVPKTSAPESAIEYFSKLAAAPEPIPTQSSEPSVELTPEELYRLASPSVITITIFDQSGHARALGSGFLVSNDGTAVTNYHVIRGAYSAQAAFKDGTTTPVLGVVGYDRGNDVAAVKLSPVASMPTLQLGDSRTISVGQKIYVLGSPLGLTDTFSEGIVSALRGERVQMSTPISHGSSGGPVLNGQGQVVAIAVAVAEGGENLNFAVPVNWAKQYVGGSPQQTLAEVAHANTVADSICDQVLSIPAGRQIAWTINVDPNRMSNAELDGGFSSSGGLGGNIRVEVLHGQQVLYDSGRVMQGQVHQDLSAGSYSLIIDNTGSALFGRNVQAHLYLSYVK